MSLWFSWLSLLELSECFGLWRLSSKLQVQLRCAEKKSQIEEKSKEFLRRKRTVLSSNLRRFRTQVSQVSRLSELWPQTKKFTILRLKNVTSGRIYLLNLPSLFFSSSFNANCSFTESPKQTKEPIVLPFEPASNARNTTEQWKVWTFYLMWLLAYE